MERHLKIWIIILLMNDKIAKVTPNDPMLLVQCTKKEFFNISETVRASATCEMFLSTRRFFVHHFSFLSAIEH